jgi:hypothetical protein
LNPTLPFHNALFLLLAGVVSSREDGSLIDTESGAHVVLFDLVLVCICVDMDVVDGSLLVSDGSLNDPVVFSPYHCL